MNMTVLMVDNSSIARMTLHAVISDLRPEWTIVEADDAEEALALAEGRTFDILLIDVGLPGMNGLDLAALLRKRYPSAVMAMVTANIQKPVRDKAAALGAAFIEKPLTGESFVRLFGEVEKRDGVSS